MPAGAWVVSILVFLDDKFKVVAHQNNLKLNVLNSPYKHTNSFFHHVNELFFCSLSTAFRIHNALIFIGVSPFFLLS
jgi:hypothetical protein